jgi:hypothetical protein
MRPVAVLTGPVIGPGGAGVLFTNLLPVVPGGYPTVIGAFPIAIDGQPITPHGRPPHSVAFLIATQISVTAGPLFLPVCRVGDIATCGDIAAPGPNINVLCGDL